MLASRVFRKTLSGEWKEGHTLADKGSTEIRLSDWNFGALLILLNIIHCRNHTLPKTIDLETLAKTVLIADYYRCLHVFNVLADGWIDQLERHFPQKYSRDLFLWLWIPWALRLRVDFYRATSLIVKHSDHWVKNPGLLIPEKVFGK